MAAIFVLILGLALTVGGATMMRASLKTRRWPVTPGRVIEKSLGPSTTSGASRAGRYVEPRVRYEYAVDGTTYVGQRIALTTNAYGEAQARKIIDSLPDTVEVHYNPHDPNDAILRPSSALGVALVMMISGVIGALVGIVMLMGDGSA